MPHDDNTKVMLYDVYQDEAAFDAGLPWRAYVGGEMVKVSGTRGTLRE